MSAGSTCGGAHLLGVQALGVVVAIAWAFAGTFVIASAVQKTMGLRVDREVELTGLDMAVHAETAYEHGGFTAART